MEVGWVAQASFYPASCERKSSTHRRFRSSCPSFLIQNNRGRQWSTGLYCTVFVYPLEWPVTTALLSLWGRWNGKKNEEKRNAKSNFLDLV